MTKKPQKTISPKLVIHGGAGSLEGNLHKEKIFAAALKEIILTTWPILLKDGARAAVLCGVRMLEDNPIFNAGTGSRLQADGIIRMSASIMDSSDGIFSAVINIQDIQHPIEAADLLNAKKHTVLSCAGACRFAAENDFPFFDPVTPDRIAEYQRRQQGDSGTVGVVALDAGGIIAAGTSTGGMGNETVGRVSDSPTVAGTYASQFAGISATGRGEDIVNLAAAARLVTMVEAGLPLTRAADRLMQLARTGKCKFGVIGIDHEGNIVADTTTDEIFYAGYDGGSLISFDLKKTT
ncbi:MAG: asparaginase [FCB group bacterium]|nr:asparaginase [FCB group bacterium]